MIPASLRVQDISVVPLTAWEQAVTVVLFIFALAWVLNWFSKQMKEWQIFMERQTTKWAEVSERQAAKWAEDAKRRDDEWRAFFSQLNEGNKDDVCKIADTLENVAVIVREVQTQLREHDSHVDARIEQVTRPVKKV